MEKLKKKKLSYIYKEKGNSKTFVTKELKTCDRKEKYKEERIHGESSDFFLLVDKENFWNAYKYEFVTTSRKSGLI